MARKIKVGIRFVDHKTWTGGAYYLANLVAALRHVGNREKYELVVFCNAADLAQAQKLLGAEDVKFHVVDRPLTVGERVGNRLSRLLGMKAPYSPHPKASDADVIFPNAEAYYFAAVPHRIFWIPDFQEDHYPDFFSPQDLAARKNMQAKIAATQRWLVLSSESAKKDFTRLYPGSTINVRILRFAVIHPEYAHLLIEELRAKYGLPENYFFAPNQFWIHKDHMTAVRAVQKLRDEGIDVTLAFSGKEDDYRSPGYADSLKKYVADHGLEKNVRFLGFLDRAEQLQLMNHAMAVVQPSLFEGWSTVVEDAKAMTQLILASGLDVHHEQLDNWEGTSAFFDCKNDAQLASQMRKVHTGEMVRKRVSYQPSITGFGADFAKIIDEIVAG